MAKHLAGHLAGVASSLMLAACSTFGVRSGTEAPRYAVVGHAGEVEIRQYGPRLAAETVVDGDAEAARSAGFRRLAGYIFGGNQGRADIAMTAPVAQAADTGGRAQDMAPRDIAPRDIAPGDIAPRKITMTAPVAAEPAGDGKWVIRFFMPAQYTAQTLPVPNDPAVKIVTIPSATLAVYRFDGSRSAEAMARAHAKLLARLQGSPWQLAGEPVDWFYDPPWTLPPFRRNETAVAVTPAAR